jgi:hypothetical protein
VCDATAVEPGTTAGYKKFKYTYKRALVHQPLTLR